MNAIHILTICFLTFFYDKIFRFGLAKRQNMWYIIANEPRGRVERKKGGEKQ